MNKGLEALKVLVMSSTTIFNTKEQIKNAKEIIEKELEEKEELQKLLEHERDLNNHLITHELKALEIIKDKLVDIDLFFYCANKSMYNNRVNIGKQLTDEEYDLLKEVLL